MFCIPDIKIVDCNTQFDTSQEIEFPRKRIALNNLAKIIEMRIVALEHYIRKILQLFTVYATMDSSASRSLRHIQNFLGSCFIFDVSFSL